MKTIRFFLPLLVVTTLMFQGLAQRKYEGIPEQPKPPKLVNDFTGTLSSTQTAQLERKLVRFSDTTSTQITVVLVNSLAGYDKAQFADLLGEQWGVGQAGKDNGIVVLIKPKTAGERGEAFITAGYGLEGAVPDAVAKRIVEEEMIPEFKREDYFEGIEKGTSILMELTAGEYTADEYMDRTQSGGGAGFFIVFLILIVIAAKLMSGRQRMHHYRGRSSSSLPFWTALFLANQMGGRSGGKWNDFSSGSGSFGGFGGGGSSFGGFGGGSFGGGGAGGSW
ncbi:MAG: TPM domain-containing protein [Bacteroidales bacterium]